MDTDTIQQSAAFPFLGPGTLISLLNWACFVATLRTGKFHSAPHRGALLLFGFLPCRHFFGASGSPAARLRNPTCCWSRLRRSALTGLGRRDDGVPRGPLLVRRHHGPLPPRLLLDHPVHRRLLSCRGA